MALETRIVDYNWWRNTVYTAEGGKKLKLSHTTSQEKSNKIWWGLFFFFIGRLHCSKERGYTLKVTTEVGVGTVEKFLLIKL